jgi:hypothetical protein
VNRLSRENEEVDQRDDCGHFLICLLAVSPSQRVCTVNFDLYKIDCHLLQILCAVAAAHAQPLPFNGAKISIPDDVYLPSAKMTVIIQFSIF